MQVTLVNPGGSSPVGSGPSSVLNASGSINIGPLSINAGPAGGGSGGGNGIIFPYTPSISFGNKANYSEYELVHTNYAINAFTNSRPDPIVVDAPFYNQTVEEAQATARAILFLRTAMKMDFGGQNPTGNPPPILLFSAYGDYNLANVPVVVTGFTTSYTQEPDYVSFEINGKQTQLPTDMSLNITLMPQYSAAQQNNFSLSSFSSGTLYEQGYI